MKLTHEELALLNEPSGERRERNKLDEARMMLRDGYGDERMHCAIRLIIDFLEQRKE